MTNSHSSTPHWRETAARWTVLALRLAVGGTFVFSGLAKAIDIWGVGYKIDDYLAAFGWVVGNAVCRNDGGGVAAV